MCFIISHHLITRHELVSIHVSSCIDGDLLNRTVVMDGSCLFIFAQMFACASIWFVHLLDVSRPAVCLVLTPVSLAVCLTDRPSALLDISSSFLSGCSSWSVHLLRVVSSRLSDIWPRCSSDLAVPLIPRFFTTFPSLVFSSDLQKEKKSQNVKVKHHQGMFSNFQQYQIIYQCRTHHFFQK